MVTTGGALFASGVVDVRRVDIRGANGALAQRVDVLAKSVLGESMFTVDTASLQHRVASMPDIAEARVSRQWPSTLRVTVTERRPVLAVKQPSGWVLVDAAGRSYATVAQRPKQVLPLTLPTTSSTGSALQAAVAVVAALPPVVRKDVVALSAPSVAGIRLRLRSGSTVVWGSAEGSARKARALAVLLRRRARVYDVSTPGFITTS